MFRKLLTVGALAAFAALSAIPAHALSPDTTRNFVVRQDNRQVTNTVRVTINFNDPNIGAGSPLNVALPAGAYILTADAYVTTAFNAATTNVVTLGTTKASANEIVASGITAGTPGVYHLTSAAGLGLAVTASSSVNLWAKYAQTGTAATTGSVTIVIEYIPNNDQ